MELPAEDWAIERSNKEMNKRYGEAVVRAALNLSKNPNDPSAHEAYFDAIKKMMER